MPEPLNQSKLPTEAVKKNKLLILDDEELFLKILTRMFSLRYDLKTAISGEEGLKLLGEGFIPEVIVSDQRMGGISGAEFLEKSIEYCPHATRVILTGYSNPKDIIACINQGKAYMYLTKPADEIQLVQAVKIAFDYYNTNMKNRRLISELKRTIQESEGRTQRLSKALQDNQMLFGQTVQVINGLSNYNESYYFTPHSKNIAIISKAIAEEHGLSPEKVQLIMITSLLVNSVALDLPRKYIVSDPHDMTDLQEIQSYMNSYFKNLELISKVGMLSTHAEILAQLWERHDGKGFPKHLSGKQWLIEAQIITMARFYHNAVYRGTPEQMTKYLSKGIVVQSFKETMQRHSEAIKMMYRRASWFELDVFNNFHDLVKRKSCPSLVPENSDLEIRNPNFDLAEASIHSPKQSDSTESNAAGSDTISMSNKPDDGALVEKEIKTEELQVGMIIGQNLITKNGMLVVRQDNILDDSLLRNIRNLESAGMVPSYITIMVAKGE